MAKRKIIKIDEEKCNGCGLCIPSCREGALQLIDGKARLVSEKYCDGLGACLGECPQGAIKIEERDAQAFDETAVKEALQTPKRHHACACPSAKTMSFDRKAGPHHKERQASTLSNWPVQLLLVNPHAPYFNDAELLLAADCVPFAYAGFHADLLAGKTLAIGCPKFDDVQLYLEKLTEILKIEPYKKIDRDEYGSAVLSGFISVGE